ncbi:MAG TPA: PAS domain S-box protein [Polyangiaceae bacterium]|nr:PAS domain S-box protein [Polyangiaceae bacterium]
MDRRDARAATWFLTLALPLVAGAVLAAHFTTAARTQRFFDNVHWTLSYGTAAGLAWLGAREEGGPKRWFAWALTFYFVGQVLWDVQVALDWNPFPGPSDLGYFLLGPLTGRGLLAFLRRSSSPDANRTLAFDVLGLTCATLAVTLALYLPRRGELTWLQLGFLVAYPVGLSAAACLALICGLVLHLAPGRGWLLLLAGLLGNGGLWLEWNARTLDHTLRDGGWFNASFSLVALTQGLGALLFRPEVSRSERWAHFCEGVLRVLPLLSIAVSAGAVVFSYTQTDIPQSTRHVLLGGALSVTVLASLRQSLLLDERERLVQTERELRRSQTNRERAESAVQKSEEKYRTLMEQAADGIFISDAAGNYLEVNPRGEEMLLVSRGALVGKAIPSILADAETARVEPEIARVRAGATSHGEWQVKRTDGSVFWAEVTAKMLLDGRILATVRDISERKLAEQKLRASEERTQLVMASTLDAVISMDQKGAIIEWNAEAERIFGWTRAEALGRMLSELIVPPEQRAAHEAGLQRFLATGESRMLGKRLELRAMRKDGSEFPVELAVVAVRSSAAEPFFSAFLRDLTESKRAAEERLELESQLRQAQKMEAVGTLAAGIAHDFNNILSAIRGNSELAALDLPPDHPARESLDEIERASRRATELVQQIVGFSRPRPRTVERVDLRELVAEVVRLLRSTLPAGVELSSEGEPLSVLADPTQLHQVLVNLCTNAWQAMEGRTGSIAIRIARRAPPNSAPLELAPGDYACVSVSDSGKGMSKEVLPRIFEPFFSTRPRGRGTGLGLSMAHSIVRAHQGTIAVESEPGVGTTFSVYLPEAPQDTAADEPSAKPQAKGEGGRKVVYVDDEEALVFLVTRQLRRRGYEVTGFSSAEAALEVVRSENVDFDVLVTDYNMPRMSGLDLIAAVRALRAGARFVLTSGFVNDEMRVLAEELGVKHVIYKPNNVEELCEAIDRVTVELFHPPRPAPTP